MKLFLHHLLGLALAVAAICAYNYLVSYWGL